jgi:hypothetical protein
MVTDTITLNGKEYVLKQKDEKIVKYEQYSKTEYQRVFKALSNLLSFATEPKNISEVIDSEEFGVMDAANVCMVIAKTPRAKAILCLFSEIENDFVKIPELDYKQQTQGKCRVSKEYLSKLFINKLFDDSRVVIESAQDFPISISDDDFRVIIAPRVDSD